MTLVKLYFSSYPEFGLHRVLFRSPLLSEEIISVRGKAASAFYGDASFQWTNAVKALAILLANAKAEILDEAGCHLSGDKGSPAASLDNALAKPPNWLVEMFGVDSKEKPVVHRLISRSNPERKQGPVVGLTAKPNLLSPENIEVVVDHASLSGAAALEAVLEFLNSDTGPAPEPESKFTDQLIERFLEREIPLRLAANDIFSERDYIKTIEGIAGGKRFQSLAKTNELNLHERELGLSKSEKLGLGESSDYIATLGEQHSRVALSVSQVSAMALFQALNNAGGNFELQLDFPSSLGLVETLLSDQASSPEFCVLALAPAAYLLSDKNANYIPLMLFPFQSYALMQPAGIEVGDSFTGHYVINDEPYSNAHFFLDKLNEHVPGFRAEVSRAEPHEIHAAFVSKDSRLRTIIGFPYYCLLESLSVAVPVNDIPDFVCTRESILFVRSDLVSNQEYMRALCVGLRDQWLNLIEDRKLVASLVKELLTNSDYLRLMHRFAGTWKSLNRD